MVIKTISMALIYQLEEMQRIASLFIELTPDLSKHFLE